MRTILCLICLMLGVWQASAQTIIELKPGGVVRSKTIDDYKEEQKMKQRENDDSLAYVDHLRRAFNALHVDSLQEAEDLFHQAIKLRPHAPGNHVVYYNLALIEFAKGRYGSAVEQLTDILKKYPGYADARLARAEACLQMGREQEAESDADQLLSNLRNSPEEVELLQRALFIRAAVRYSMHRYNEARADLSNLLEQVPDHENAMVLEALILLKMGQPREAFNRLNRIVSMYPESREALVARAEIETDLEMYVLARADYDTLIRLYPQARELYVERAKVLIRLKEKHAARKDLDKAVELGVSHGEVQALLQLLRKM